MFVEIAEGMTEFNVAFLALVLSLIANAFLLGVDRPQFDPEIPIVTIEAGPPPAPEFEEDGEGAAP